MQLTLNNYQKQDLTVKFYLFLLFLIMIGVVSIYILNDYNLFENYNRQNKIENNQNSSSNKNNIKIDNNKEMHQLGKHFNKHGREMGYSTKSEYQKAASDFANKYSTHSRAKIMEGTWNGKGNFANFRQITISFEEKTVVLDKQTGQLIDFYKGTELRGFKNLIQLFP